MISDIFIKRPRLAIVVSLIFTIAGGLAWLMLPVEQFPDVTPPQVQVAATYPGANADVIESSVAQQIESAVNGVEDMLYMSSNSSDDGRYTLTVTFAVGTDPDTAAMNVQNRVKQVEPKLPEDVVKLGVSVRQQMTSMLQIFAVTSTNKLHDLKFLTNYVLINIKDELARVRGVGDLFVFSSYEYSMRVWVSDDKLKSLNLSTTELVRAIESQNLQASVGTIGTMPAPKEQMFRISLTAKGRLSTPEEFGNIIIRANSDGSYLKLKDVARVDLGVKSEDMYGTFNGMPSVGLAVFQSPGSNAIDVAAGIAEKIEQMKPTLPEGISFQMMFDNAAFVKKSMAEIEETLIIAFILVVLVIYFFLGSARTTLIPLLAIPVSLVGALAGMMALGVTLNTVSLLALVLAIGVVVDDAIVVVEDVESVMTDNPNDKPEEYVKKSMNRITNPIIATTLILLGVFVPVAFMPGITGLLYRQFAIAISCAVVISAINALTLSPALSRLLIRRNRTHPRVVQKAMNGVEVVRQKYAHAIARLIPHYKVVIPALLVVGALALTMFKITPTGFLPTEDQGSFLCEIQLPAGASLNRTMSVIQQVEERARTVKGVSGYLAVAGYGILAGGTASNSAFMAINLDDYEKRQSPDLLIDKVIANFAAATADIKEAIVLPFNVPALAGVSMTEGFEYMLQTTQGDSPAQLMTVANQLIAEANKHPALKNVMTFYRVDSPKLSVDIDREKAYALGVPVSEIFASMQTILGGTYINDFNLYGRSWQVIMQGDMADRSTLDDVFKIELKNSRGQMVPLRSVVKINKVIGASNIQRFNNYRSIKITGTPADGYSSGEAIAAMIEVSKNVLPTGYTYQWTGTAVQEMEAGAQTMLVFIMAFVFGYLFLVGLYESWTLPMTVMLSIVVGFLGAIGMIYWQSMNDSYRIFDDLYAQIGMVVLIGLAAKNAILMVEFAKLRHEDFKDSIPEAAQKAGELRFRAIMMTAISSLVGFLPLVIATGAGALSRRAIGSAIFGGMAFSAFLAIFFVPLLYVLFQTMAEKVMGTHDDDKQS